MYCRSLCSPAGVVDTTEHLLRMSDDFWPRRVDLRRVDERYFAFSSGIGLDANVVARVDSHPRLKATLSQWYYTYAAISTFNRRYLVRPPHVEVEVGERRLAGVTVVVQNSDPYTYFGDRPIRICADTGFDTGTLGLTVLRRATPLELPTVLWRAFSGNAETMARHRQIEASRDVTEARVTAAEDRPFPLQVDGDFIGEFHAVRYGVAPRALSVVS